MTRNLLNTLEEHYKKVKTPRLSYFKQMRECQSVLDLKISLDKTILFKALKLKLGSLDTGLVESVRFVLYNYDKVVNYQYILANLLWVDFSSVTLIRRVL